MLYRLTEFLTQYYSGFRVFGYLTFRGILAALTSLVIALVVGAAVNLEIDLVARYVQRLSSAEL